MDESGTPELPPFIVTDAPSRTLIVERADIPTPIVSRFAAAPARPGHFAEREELDAALQAGTSDALRLFIERHPDSRYRAEAQDALRRLSSTLSR